MKKNNWRNASNAWHLPDELVVVLNKCTDGSDAIAALFTENLIEGSWDIEGDRRNTGLDTCTGDWILEVDADEKGHAGTCG